MENAESLSPLPDVGSQESTDPFCRDHYAAVIVTYHPTSALNVSIRALRSEVGFVVVVDNANGLAARPELVSDIQEFPGRVLANVENLGVAAALNQGIAYAAGLGFKWVVTLDQDSIPVPGMVRGMVDCWRRHSHEHRIAGIGPVVTEEHFPDREEKWLMQRGNRLWFGFRKCRGADLVGVTILITSGMLVSIDAWRSLGYFDEGLFIDGVDFDFCLNAVSKGWTLIVSADAKLLHNLGERQLVHCFGRCYAPTNHSPTRHYYMARNRVHLLRRYALKIPHWWISDTFRYFKSLLRVLLVERDRRSKLYAACHGAIDGLRGRLGACPQP